MNYHWRRRNCEPDFRALISPFYLSFVQLILHCMLIRIDMWGERYCWQGLRLNNDEIVRLRSKDMKNLLRHKKLHLILDLDHTLLNSSQLVHMTPEEEYLKSQIDSLQGITLFALDVVLLSRFYWCFLFRRIYRTPQKFAYFCFRYYKLNRGNHWFYFLSNCF